MVQYTDLVFPNGNEAQLVAMATRLGIHELLFCYKAEDPLSKSRIAEATKYATKECAITPVILVKDLAGVDKAKAITKNVATYGSPAVFEDKRIKYVLGMETGHRDDFIHHRNSGLNQVFIEQSKRTGKTLLINLRPLITESIPQAVFLGRVQQNNTFFRKYKPAVMVVSGAKEPLEMRSPRDLQMILQI